MPRNEQEEEISYKELREIQQKEKRSSLLTRVIPSFYQRVFDFIEQLEQEYQEKELPSQKRRLVEEELENMRRVAMGIYEQREKKIVQAALASLRGASSSLSNMTKEEKSLFEGVKHALQETRGRVIEQQETDEPSSTDSESSDEETTDASSVEEEKNEVEAEKQGVVVRVKRDVPAFIGPDMKEYSLRKDDVVVLPENMAGTMVEKNAAENVETRWL